MTKKFLQETNFEADPSDEWYIDSEGIKRIKMTGELYHDTSTEVELVATLGDER